MVLALMEINDGSANNLTTSKCIIEEVAHPTEKQKTNSNGINPYKSPLRTSGQTLKRKNMSGENETTENDPPLHNVIQPEERDRERKQIATNSGKQRKAAINNKQLKDLLILQLDLIEHQQTKITHKDKQIISLRSEKEQVFVVFILYLASMHHKLPKKH